METRGWSSWTTTTELETIEVFAKEIHEKCYILRIGESARLLGVLCIDIAEVNWFGVDGRMNILIPKWKCKNGNHAKEGRGDIP